MIKIKKSCNDTFSVKLLPSDLDISNINAYSGYYNNKKKLFSCASGGAATAISENFIDNGGIVFGVRYTEDFKGAFFAKAQTKEELIQLKSSKYIYADKKIYDGEKLTSIFSEVEKILNTNKKVLFIGLGCDVGAIVKYLDNHEVDRKNFYTIDLICHGPTYPEIQKDYVEALENRFDSKLRSFSVRYKKKGWIPPFIHAEFENGKIFEEKFYESDFGYAFVNYSKKSCYNCRFKGNNHLADITIGDFWGCEKHHEGYNSMGVSILFSRSAKGNEIIKLLKSISSFDIRPADKEFAIKNNENYYRPRKMKQEIYDKFDKDFHANGLHYAVINSPGYRKYKNQKYKNMIKKFLPKKLVIVLKRIKHKNKKGE